MRTRFVASLAVALAVLVGVVTPVSTAAASSSGSLDYLYQKCGSWTAVGKVQVRACLEVTPTTIRPVMQVQNTASSKRVVTGSWWYNRCGYTERGTSYFAWGAAPGFNSTGLAAAWAKSSGCSSYLRITWSYQGAGYVTRDALVYLS